MIYAYIITFVCMVMYVLGPVYAYGTTSGHIDHMLYGISHANALHLGLNMYALWMFRPRGLTCLVGAIISIVASYLPLAAYDLPTCGLSAFLMACFARRYAAWGKNILPVLCAQIILIPFPYINAAVHLYSFIIGYIVWYGIYSRSA